MEAQTLVLRLPGLLQAQVTAAHQVGLYADETDLITDAVRMLNGSRCNKNFRARIIYLIPAFILACKTVGLIDIETIAQIIKDLRNKDFYEFKKDIRDELLK